MSSRTRLEHTTQATERAAAIAAAMFVLESEAKQAASLPAGESYDVRIVLQGWVNGVRIYEPITAGGLLQVARKTGRPRFKRRRNHKGV